MLSSLKESGLLLVCLLCASQITGTAQQPPRPSRSQMEEARKRQVFEKAQETFDNHFVEVNGFLVTQRHASIKPAGDSINDLVYCKDVSGFNNPIFEPVKAVQNLDIEQVATFKIKAGHVFVFSAKNEIKLLGQDTDALIMTIILHKSKQAGWRIKDTIFEYRGTYLPHMKRQPARKELIIIQPTYRRPPDADNPFKLGFALLSTNASEAKKIMSVPPPPAVYITPDSMAESFAGQYVADNFIQCSYYDDRWFSIVDGTALLEIESVGYEINTVKLSNISDPSEADKYRLILITGTRYRNNSINKDFVMSASSPILWVLVHVSTKAVTVDSVGWYNPKSNISTLKKPSSCEQVQSLKRP